MTRKVELRLIGHRSDDGELLAADALRLIESFKDVTYRLTRAVAERAGLGRAPADLETLATVRVALREGSTRVVFVVGDEGALEMDDPISAGVDAAFWSLVEGIEDNRRPEGISDAVAESVGHLVDALVQAAPGVEVTVPPHDGRVLHTHALDTAVWERQDVEPVDDTVLRGVLEMVDLHTARFRLRDTAGSTIDLVEVVNAEDAAHLVGEQVRATGTFFEGTGTRHHRLTGATVDPSDLAERLGPAADNSLDTALARARSAPEPPEMDLDDEELDEFLAEIRA